MDRDGYVPVTFIDGKKIIYHGFALTACSSKRKICDLSLFDIERDREDAWEQAYQQTMNPKYMKLTRNFGMRHNCFKWKGQGDPPIFLIPRERGGPSYKDVKLEGCETGNVFFAPVSKGYSMQDVSSFTLGPVVGEGLCVVNAAFSKCICIFHIEGGGKLDLKSKNFWKRTRNPTRNVKMYTNDMLEVDGEFYDVYDWLNDNRDLWFEEFDLWRKHIALCDTGDFHWTRDEDPLAYFVDDKIVNFVIWKKKAYIEPAYKLIPETPVYKFLFKLWKTNKVALGLVHPMAKLGTVEKPITTKYIRDLYDSEHQMCCLPYVFAGYMLGVEI
jgi:hypothetical protein